MRKLLLLLVVAVCVGAQAQAPQKQQMPTRVMPGVSQAAKMQVDPVASLQAQVRGMKLQIQELKRQIDMLVKDSQTAKANVPHCSADMRTSSSAQGSRGCEPYTCDSVVGTCMMSCATTNDCSPGNVCDVMAARCVNPNSQ